MRETAASTEKIPLDSRPPFGEELQDLLTEKTGYRVSSLVDCGSCILLYVLEDLAHVSLFLVG